MQKIESFKINHMKLVPGIYISRKDTFNNVTLTTIDIRTKRPNYEDCMSPEVAHTIEHLGATYFRNLEGFKEKVVYFGPMGCLTGFYLIVQGDYSVDSSEYVKLVDTIINMFRYVVKFKGKIPGATKEECGNYKMNDLKTAQLLAANMLVLKNDFNILEYVYPNDNDKQQSINQEYISETALIEEIEEKKPDILFKKLDASVSYSLF